MNLLNQVKVVVVASTLERHWNHDRGGGTGLRDEPVANDNSSRKEGESSLLKAKLIPRSYGMLNSLVMKEIFFRNLKEPVHQTFSSFTTSRWLVTITSISIANTCNNICACRKFIASIAICQLSNDIVTYNMQMQCSRHSWHDSNEAKKWDI